MKELLLYSEVQHDFSYYDALAVSYEVQSA
jgi:hypothetical protein